MEYIYPSYTSVKDCSSSGTSHVARIFIKNPSTILENNTILNLTVLLDFRYWLVIEVVQSTSVIYLHVSAIVNTVNDASCEEKSQNGPFSSTFGMIDCFVIQIRLDQHVNTFEWYR